MNFKFFFDQLFHSIFYFFPEACIEIINFVLVPPFLPYNGMDAAPPQLRLEPLNPNNSKPKLIYQNPNGLSMGDRRQKPHIEPQKRSN
jgi:hypothetical protein